MSEEDFPDIHLRVLYDFEYSVKDDRKIRIQEGEKLFLIKKTNSDWWQVIRNSSERPFYVPAAYVKECLCSQDTSKEISHHRSGKRHKENEAKASVPSSDVKNKSSESLKCEKETSILNISCPYECKTSRGHSETQPHTFQNVNKNSSDMDSLIKEDASHILFDKRKSWAVEELVAELSKVRTERDCCESSSTKADDEEHSNENSITSCSPHMSCSCIHSYPDDNSFCSNKHSLSVASDKTDNSVQGIKKHSAVRSCVDISEGFTRVCTVPCEGSKNVGKVICKPSESWEKLAQEVHFSPPGTLDSRASQINFSGSLNEPSTITVSAVDNTKMDSAFKRVKSKLQYSSSFKTKKEVRALKRWSGNSLLSTSRENALSECKESKDIKLIPDEKKLKNSEHVSSALIGLDHDQLKSSHSGSDLEVLQKESGQPWNVGEKSKGISVVSGSESEENLDEGSTSGLSDDILCQSATSKVCSDISDGAVSDDLVIESLDKVKEVTDGSSSHVQLQKKRMLLSRKKRVESRDVHGRSSPPSPSPTHKSVRVLNEGWEEFKSSHGRTYYYNYRTNDKSWKPPRRHHSYNENTQDGSIKNLQSDMSLRAEEVNGAHDIPIPVGWREAYDDVSGEVCYVNIATGVKWFSSCDEEGRVYFFEENSNESSWTLPDSSNAGCDNHAHSPNPEPIELGRAVKEAGKNEHHLDTDVQLRSDRLDCQSDDRVQHRMTKAHSMVLANSRKKQTSSKSSSIPRNWPQLCNGNMCVLKEGTLNRTKITENGKKVRKNWAPAHVVLTELFLLFFKDAKTFVAMKSSPGDSPSGQPEFCIDLNGAVLEHSEKASSRRRNVFLLTAMLRGLQVLLQCDSAQQEDEWFKAIQKAIQDLPSGYDVSPKNVAAKPNPQPLSSNSPEETKKSSYIGRSKSVKLKLTSKDGSQEDLTVNSEENQTKIRNRLKKFFHRRPSKDMLVKKGIYKDEPVFGCHLADVCKGESPKVPAFVQRCVAAIEHKEENMKTDGLYRASGNLSQVQKIRLQVDQNNLVVLDQEEDVHVLTGALKLFFRELKKPLIPFEHFSKALQASTNPNKKEKLQHFREIVKALPVPNRDTFEFLLRHLLRVTSYKEFNRMHIPNLAIVFGPTLMWPEEDSANMALELMQQNLVIECFLQDFYSIFG